MSRGSSDGAGVGEGLTRDLPARAADLLASVPCRAGGVIGILRGVVVLEDMAVGHRDVALRYGAVLAEDDAEKRRIDNVSAVAFGGGHLWTATDEKATFERLTADKGGLVYDAAASFRLKDIFGDEFRKVEADIEGLCFNKPKGRPARLWMTGSHALVRKKYTERDSGDLLGRTEGMGASEAKLRRENARTLLGLVNIVAGKPVKSSARMLPLGDGEGSLIATLRAGWRELAHATERPAKENGLDIEGIAVDGMKVFLGLRGPVVGPYGIILEVDVQDTGSALEILRPAKLPACRPHLIHTGGLGIRDLALHADGLAVLAGPTMDMDGPFEIRMAAAPASRWDPADLSARNTVLLKELGSQGGTRRPEGIALLDGKVLVVSERKDKDNDPQVLMAEELVIPVLA